MWGSGVWEMTEPSVICASVLEKVFGDRPLKGIKAIVTAGPTQEPIDPVRYLSNTSSGKQGYAISEALLQNGAEVTLITGPTSLLLPSGAQVVRVQTAEEMWKATESNLPADVAICTAAVADWRPENTSSQKLKKEKGFPTLSLKQNPDILASLAQHKKRPRLLIGFAAETENVLENAKTKLAKCDWVIANDVSQGVFGSDENQVHFVTPSAFETWPLCSKREVAEKLVSCIKGALK